MTTLSIKHTWTAVHSKYQNIFFCNLTNNIQLQTTSANAYLIVFQQFQNVHRAMMMHSVDNVHIFNQVVSKGAFLFHWICCLIYISKYLYRLLCINNSQMCTEQRWFILQTTFASSEPSSQQDDSSFSLGFQLELKFHISAVVINPLNSKPSYCF